jgi:hypothetical protein
MVQSNFARILTASVILELYRKHADVMWLTSNAGELKKANQNVREMLEA